MPATRSSPGASGPDGPQSDAAPADAVTDPPDLLPDGLTDAQRRAVAHTGGPLLVVAGPGAGKTSVMVRRAAWLVCEHGVDPGSLLVTTFTNEAAEELFARLHRFLGARTNDVHISTLHSFCRTLLEDHPEAHAWGPGFRVLDAREQFLPVYGRLKQLGLSEFPKSRKGDFIQDVLSAFNLSLESRPGLHSPAAASRHPASRLLGVVALRLVVASWLARAAARSVRHPGRDPSECTSEQVASDRLVAEVEARGPALLGLEEDAPEAVEEYRAVAEAYGRYWELLREEACSTSRRSRAWPDEGICKHIYPFTHRLS